ncbi:MAG: hypothetical protein ACLFVL_00025 [Candidatus Aenigmatarchaeota archaeon]
MDDSKIDRLLERTIAEFRSGGGKVEEGLDVDDPSLLQLRKSCRLLKAVNTMKEENGYYTLIIEASFSAIERTIQFYLLESEYIRESDYVSHEDIYEGGVEVGLYGRDFKDDLLHLWRNNRSRTYYREGIGTAKSSELMSEIANKIHHHTLQLARKSHECICDD